MIKQTLKQCKQATNQHSQTKAEQDTCTKLASNRQANLKHLFKPTTSTNKQA